MRVIADLTPLLQHHKDGDIIPVKKFKDTMNRIIKTPEEALLYLTDCNLATVSEMASKKSRGKWEFERQIEIAQKAINWVLEFNINVQINSRAYDVLSLNDRSVETWSKQFYPK